MARRVSEPEEVGRTVLGERGHQSHPGSRPGASPTSWPSRRTSPTASWRKPSIAGPRSNSYRPRSWSRWAASPAGVAHDFNNLLNVIQGYAELMLRAESEDPKVQERVEQILKASRRAADLTRQLLAFSRRQILEPRVVDLSVLVADLEKMLRRLIGENIVLDVIRPDAVGADQGGSGPDRAGAHEPRGQRPGRDAGRGLAHHRTRGHGSPRGSRCRS